MGRGCARPVVIVLRAKALLGFVGVFGFLAGVQIAARMAQGQPELILLLIAAGLGVIGAIRAIVLQRIAVAVAGWFGRLARVPRFESERRADRHTPRLPKGNAHSGNGVRDCRRLRAIGRLHAAAAARCGLAARGARRATSRENEDATDRTPQVRAMRDVALYFESLRSTQAASADSPP